jgi:hypothetical protein
MYQNIERQDINVKKNIASEAMSVNNIPACYTTVVVHNLPAGFSC